MEWMRVWPNDSAMAIRRCGGTLKLLKFNYRGFSGRGASVHLVRLETFSLSLNPKISNSALDAPSNRAVREDAVERQRH